MKVDGSSRENIQCPPPNVQCKENRRAAALEVAGSTLVRTARYPLSFWDAFPLFGEFPARFRRRIAIATLEGHVALDQGAVVPTQISDLIRPFLGEQRGTCLTGQVVCSRPLFAAEGVGP